MAVIAGFAVALLLAGLSLAFVLVPLLRRDDDEDPGRTTALSEARELQSQRDMLLASLKDLEDDRATDKIGEEDFQQLQARLSAEAIEVLRRLDALEQERERAELADHPVLTYPGPRRADPR